MVCLWLCGCACPLCTKGNQGGEIRLYPDTIAVNHDSTVVLEAAPNPFEPCRPVHYQWQRIMGEADDGSFKVEDIRGATTDKLVLRRVQSEDARLYRCAIYTTDELPDTNYTALFSLQVSGVPAMAVLTVVSGSFKPGNGGGTSCYKYKDGIVFKNPTTGNWWLAPTSSQPGMATIADHSIIDYQKYPAFIQVINGKGKTCLCTNLPNQSLQFQSQPGEGYLIGLCFTSPLPQTGQQFSFQITWP